MADRPGEQTFQRSNVPTFQRDDAVVVSGLRLRYPETGRVVLKGVDLRLRRGEVKLLLGPSGSGKSSLALTLNGLIPHQVDGEIRGSVLVNGRDTREAGVPWLTSQVGMVFQDPEAQIATLTVGDEVAFGMENLRVPPEEMPRRATEALGQVDLLGMEGTLTEALSGGQKQRLALASTLAMGTSILVFDEPTANLDPAGGIEFFALLARLKSAGATILIIEHNLDYLIANVDSVEVLEPEGTIAVSGSPREVMRDRADILRATGVWKPQVAELADSLRARGVTLDPYPLTVHEAVAALLRALEKSDAAEMVGAPAGGRPSEHMHKFEGGDGTVPHEQGAGETGELHSAASTNGGAMGELSAVDSVGAPAAIEVNDLWYAYPEGAVALKGASLRVEHGDFFAIVGPNGSGKSTLARHLIGLLAPQRGSVRVMGDDAARLPARELHERIAYVFQNPEHQFVTLTVYDELAFSLRARGVPEADITRLVEPLLAEFGREEHRGANPFSLSQGQKRRLSVATMLALDPRVLVLDEPTFGQDRTNAESIMRRLQELNRRGVTVVIITHDMKLVADCANHLAVMVDGAVAYLGDVPGAFSDPDLMRQANLVAPPLLHVSWALRDRYPTFPLAATVEAMTEAVCELSGTSLGRASSTA